MSIRLKQLLKSMGISMATGLSFTLGLVLAAGAFEALFEAFEDESPVQVEYVELPGEIRITKHKQVPAENFTVAGVLENNSDQRWDRVSVEVTVFAENARVNGCNHWINRVMPNKTRNFRIECSGVSGSGLPDNVHYEIRAESGRRFSTT